MVYFVSPFVSNFEYTVSSLVNALTGNAGVINIAIKAHEAIFLIFFFIFIFLSFLLNPSVVLQINLSNIIRSDGTTVITTIILIIAPLEISVQSDPIISILETTPTPIVAAKKHNPLTTIEVTELSNAIFIESSLLVPFCLSSKYLVVINIA